MAEMRGRLAPFGRRSRVKRPFVGRDAELGGDPELAVGARVQGEDHPPARPPGSVNSRPPRPRSAAAPTTCRPTSTVRRGLERACHAEVAPRRDAVWGEPLQTARRAEPDVSFAVLQRLYRFACQASRIVATLMTVLDRSPGSSSPATAPVPGWPPAWRRADRAGAARPARGDGAGTGHGRESVGALVEVAHPHRARSITCETEMQLLATATCATCSNPASGETPPVDPSGRGKSRPPPARRCRYRRGGSRCQVHAVPPLPGKRKSPESVPAHGTPPRSSYDDAASVFADPRPRRRASGWPFSKRAIGVAPVSAHRALIAGVQQRPHRAGRQRLVSQRTKRNRRSAPGPFRARATGSLRALRHRADAARRAAPSPSMW